MNRLAERLNGITERRTVNLEVETRASGDTLTFTGYASLFDTPYDMYGGPSKGGWTETVDPVAFKRTLSQQPDVVLLVNHDGLPLARTSSGTLKLSTDAKGLRAAASLDVRDPDVQRLAVKMERRDMSQMSFAFRTVGQLWTDNDSRRHLTELNLHQGDVSIVTNGASPTTSAELHSIEEALDYLVNADLAEMRTTNSKALRAARRVLTAVTPNVRDADGNPAAMAQAIDAVLDAITEALSIGDCPQAQALVDAAEFSVDALLAFYGATDADDTPAPSGMSTDMPMMMNSISNLDIHPVEPRQGTVAAAEALVIEYATARHA